jgi:hypothetical protein
VTNHLATYDYTPPTLDWSHLGWGEETEREDSKRYRDATLLEMAMNRRPALFQPQPVREFEPGPMNAFLELHKQKGYEDGSCDLSLIDEFYWGRRFHWLPQDTGSCTISNTFRCWVRRALFETLMRGQLENNLGKQEYGRDTVSFYAPLSYGIARQKGNLRRGDGGFCSTTIDSLMEGVLDCNNGRLSEILNNLRADSERDYPEPRSTAVYRNFQNWTYNEELKPFLTSPLVESIKVTSAATLDDQLKQFKPAIMCSMLAVKRGGDHQGLSYFVADTRNQWAHNMCWCGRVVWHGRTFFLLSNESWRDDLIYPIPAEHVDEVIFPRYRPEVMTLGEIDLDDSKIAS